MKNQYPMNTFPSKALKFFFFLLLGTFSFSGFSNDTIGDNQIDSNGKRQGYWIITGSMTTELGYDAKAKVEEGNYVDSRKEGLWKKYWPTGTIKSEINYISGKPKGKYAVYYKNGQLEESGNWNKNKNTGEFKRFYKNGNPQQEFIFSENGKRNGVQKYYHENGQLELVATIIDGKEDGVVKRYFDNGKLKEEKTMKAGVLSKGSIKSYDKNPKPFVAKADSNAKESKKVSDRPNIQKFEPNGRNTLYNKRLQKTQVGMFKNGRLWEGRWYRYDANGILTKIEVYKQGRYFGTTVESDK